MTVNLDSDASWYFYMKISLMGECQIPTNENTGPTIEVVVYR